MVVGNVPFSSHRPGRNNPHGDSLHNLAIGRSVAMLRPGGVAAVLTSRFSLDAGKHGLAATTRRPGRSRRGVPARLAHPS